MKTQLKTGLIFTLSIIPKPSLTSNAGSSRASDRTMAKIAFDNFSDEFSRWAQHIATDTASFHTRPILSLPVRAGFHDMKNKIYCYSKAFSNF